MSGCGDVGFRNEMSYKIPRGVFLRSRLRIHDVRFRFRYEMVRMWKKKGSELSVQSWATLVGII